MKKPFRGDGMAFAEMLYDDFQTNVAHPDLTIKCCAQTCPGLIVVRRYGRNLSLAIQEANEEISRQLVNKLLNKFCAVCAMEFDDSYKEGLK